MSIITTDWIDWACIAIGAAYAVYLTLTTKE